MGLGLFRVRLRNPCFFAKAGTRAEKGFLKVSKGFPRSENKRALLFEYTYRR